MFHEIVQITDQYTSKKLEKLHSSAKFFQQAQTLKPAMGFLNKS